MEEEIVELLLDALHPHAEVLQETHDLGAVLQADLGQQEGAAELHRVRQLHIHGRLGRKQEVRQDGGRGPGNRTAGSGPKETCVKKESDIVWLGG